ncbi:MAG: SGNH/GDSL hydrolase family protein [Bacilli bacterium]|jgi:lysophospholipase L1-like esterase
MKIVFLGDSITDNLVFKINNKRYPELVCKHFNAKELNYGVSGTRIARQRVHVPTNPDEDFILRARWIDYTCDMLFVFGGTNDWGHGDAPLGKFGDVTPYTFYGALKQLIDYLLIVGKLPKEKICFILPLYRYNENNPKSDHHPLNRTVPRLKEYRQAIKQVCGHYGIDYLVIEGIPMPDTQQPSEFFHDGLHPNDKGHQVIADELIAYLTKKGFK